LQFEGLHLRVDRAAQNSQGGRSAAGVVYDPTRTLFVGNLHLDIEVRSQTAKSQLLLLVFQQ
jgi:hypothetical protein